MAQKIFEWVCPECGKEIKSLYERQLEQQKDAHLFSHKQKKEVENNGR